MEYQECSLFKKCENSTADFIFEEKLFGVEFATPNSKNLLESPSEIIDITSKRCECPFCDLLYETPKLLARHLKSGHNNVYPCTLCSDTFQKRSSLYSHTKRYHGEKKYICKCGKGFSMWGDYNSHLRRQLNMKKKRKCSAFDSNYTFVYENM